MDAFQRFLKNYSKHSYGKGEVILQQDQLPATAYIVKSGIIKAYNLTANGDEKPIAFSLPGDIFPIEWVFSNSNRTQYFYETLTSCELYHVPSAEYLRFLKNEPAVLYELFKNFIGQHLDNQMRINALEQSRASDKVAYTLLFLAKRYGKKSGSSHVKIQVPFTQQDMANFMGLARETAAIELKKLERLEVISYQNRSYMIRVDTLQQILGENDVFEGITTPSNRAIALTFQSDWASKMLTVKPINK